MKAVCITPDGHARGVPDSATILRRNPWFVPADGTPGQWRATLYAGAVIDRLGMCIRAKFAGRYYSRLAVCAAMGNPGADADYAWIRDGALVVGDVQPEVADGITSVRLAGEPEREYSLPAAEDLDRAIEAVSAFMTLKTGDMVLLPIGCDVPVPEPPMDLAVEACTEGGQLRLLLFKAR